MTDWKFQQRKNEMEMTLESVSVFAKDKRMWFKDEALRHKAGLNEHANSRIVHID